MPSTSIFATKMERFCLGRPLRSHAVRHDWQYNSVTVTPTKPIKSVAYYVLLRNKTGKAWFDDVSLKVLDDPKASREVLQGGDFERPSRATCIVDVAQSKRLPIPAYSGRVFLYASGTKDDLAKPGPRLTIATQPGLGEVCFRVDGIDYWTHCGRWAIDFIKGPEFGGFSIHFDKPGKHVVEVVDVVPGDLNTRATWASGDPLNKFMNPSNPPSRARGESFTSAVGPARSRPARPG